MYKRFRVIMFIICTALPWYIKQINLMFYGIILGTLTQLYNFFISFRDVIVAIISVICQL